jgi:ubiquitin-protein ligase E3 C
MLFLKFVTNCRRPPVFGFANLNPKFMIQKLQKGEGIETRLPIAAVCFNVIKLPVYDTPAILKQKLLQAINSGSGYYIV